MSAQKNPDLGARALEWYRAVALRRVAQKALKRAYEDFKSRHGQDDKWGDTGTEHWRAMKQATQAAYDRVQKAKDVEKNAKARLERACRGVMAADLKKLIPDMPSRVAP